MALLCVALACPAGEAAEGYFQQRLCARAWERVFAQAATYPLEPRRVAPAVQETLEREVRAGRDKMPPELRAGAPGKQFLMDFEKRLYRNRRNRWGTAKAPIPLTEVRDGDGYVHEGVYVVERRDGTFYFRDLRERGVGEIRFPYVASRLSELMEIDAAPEAFFGWVNGRPGLFSREVSGRPLPVAVDTRETFLRWVAEGRIQRESASEAEAFAFLTGNTDVHGENLRIDSAGRVRVFDFDYSFESIPPDTPSQKDLTAFGPYLPERYSRRFLRGLRRLTDEVLDREFSDYLTPEELRALKLRRDVILQDARRRSGARLR